MPGPGLLASLVTEPARTAAAQAIAEARHRDDQARLALIAAEAASSDRWTERSRPTFLYVMYILLLWSIPMGLLAAVRPAAAAAIAAGMKAYLDAIPEPLYALFATGYLGYTVAHSWARTKRAGR